MKAMRASIAARPHRIKCTIRLAPLPPAGLALVLLLEPGLQRGEVFDEGRAIHLARAGEGFEGVGPGLAGAHFEHLGELRADFLVAVDRAAMERAGPAGLA